MPAICIFYGIIIRMYNEKGGKHHKPHIHAEYQGKEIVIALDGDILEDSDKFPKNKLKLIDAWMEIHREDLEANLSNCFRKVRSFSKSRHFNNAKKPAQSCGQSAHIFLLRS